MEQANKELAERRKEFTDALDKKLSLEDIRSDFSSLKRLSEIETKLNEMAEKVVGKGELFKNLEDIKKLIGELNDKAKKVDEGKSRFRLFGK